MASREWLAVAVLATAAAGVVLSALVPERVLARAAVITACASAFLAVALASIALADPASPQLGRWIVVDAAGGLLVGLIGIIGLASTLVSPPMLRHLKGSLFQPHRAERVYWITLFAFWAVLLAVPLAGNLGAAWLAIEATTAASALLVGFSGRGRALEAGWKYLILTSLGLGIALLGILVLAASGSGRGLETLSWRSLPDATLDPDLALVAYVLLLAGLAAKIGWAPVHNWLPDAHSEAPAPVSALLSAALLPSVLLVAWRTQQALAPTIGERTAGSVLIGFGLLSLAVAVPFLWRSQAWKRLLAYSSLEHMGVIALGIGFGGPLALAGVAVHITGHAIAKALGFYAATPLLGHEPRAAGHAVGGIGRTQPMLGASLGISLGALAGVPPSPLFVSEVLIVAGGFQMGHPWAASSAAILLALGFLGLAHALIDTLIGKPRRRDRETAPGLHAVTVLTAAASTALLALTVAALWLPGSAIVDGLLRGLGCSRLHPTGDAYRDAVAAALADGWRFASLHATTDHGSPAVRTLLSSAAGDYRLEGVDASPGSVPTVVDLAPAAGWDEREAHDLYGVGFDGHEPLRLLADHDGAFARFATPVRGTDPYEVAVGPIHAGVIESGHFRFHVVGDLILHVDARLFYKHRGLERAAEGLTFADGLPVVARACAGCWVTNAVAYAHACEELLGLIPTPGLARVRTMLLELERVWNTLNDIAAVCAGVGLAAGGSRFAALVDDARRLNLRLTGHRFLFGSVRVGGSDLAIEDSTAREARDLLDRIRADSSRAWRELLFNASFMDRMPDIGIVDTETARSLGVVGPAARASGVAEDVRTTSPRLAYEGFEAAALHRPVGDVQARLTQRALELLPCLDILDRLLTGPVRPAAAATTAAPAPIGIGRVEGPRGVTSCIVERDGSRVARVRLRTGSYANWPAVAFAAAGNLLPDFPLINKSFELCYACVDR